MASFSGFAKAICYLSLMYGNLELSRLILQYITYVYKIPLLPSFFLNFSPTDPITLSQQPIMPFFLEFAFVAIGIFFVLGLAIKGIVERLKERPVHGRCDRCVLSFNKLGRNEK